MVTPSVDLLGLLRPRQVVVNVTGVAFALQAHNASQWLGAVALDMEDLSGIMPGLVADDDLDAMEQIMEHTGDIADRWQAAARTALGRAAGRDWWWARNLCRKALGTWMYTNGLLLRQNVSAKDMQLGDWMDACYTLYWQNADEAAQITLDLELSALPAGIRVRQSKASTKKMNAAFAAD